MRTGQAPFGVIQFALALHDDGLRRRQVAFTHPGLRFGARHAGNRLLLLGARLIALRGEHIDLHLRQHLVCLHKISLQGENLDHAPRILGGDIDLGGFDTAIAADKAFAQAFRAGHRPHAPGEQRNGNGRSGQEQVFLECRA